MAPAGSLVTTSLDLAAIFDEHYGLVWRTLHLLGVRGDAVDSATERTFVAVYHLLVAAPPPAELRPLLLRVLHAVALQEASTARRTDELSAGGPPHPAPQGGILAAYRSERTPAAEARERMWAAILRRISNGG